MNATCSPCNSNDHANNPDGGWFHNLPIWHLLGPAAHPRRVQHRQVASVGDVNRRLTVGLGVVHGEIGGSQEQVLLHVRRPLAR